MRGKSTDDLKQELMEQASLDQYITENKAYFAETDLTDVLARLYERCRLSKAELARQAEMSEVYSTRSFPGGAGPPGIGCCVCVLGWIPHWKMPTCC